MKKVPAAHDMGTTEDIFEILMRFLVCIIVGFFDKGFLTNWTFQFFGMSLSQMFPILCPLSKMLAAFFTAIKSNNLNVIKKCE